MNQAGSIMVEWDALGHLTIRASFSINNSDARKAAVEKLLDAARAVNNQGSPLVVGPSESIRLHSLKG